MQDIDTSDDIKKLIKRYTMCIDIVSHNDLVLAQCSPCNLYVYHSAMQRLEVVAKKYRIFLHSENEDGFLIRT